jgi:biofilm protein TabA
MIYDKLSAIATYKGLHPNLDLAIQYLQQHNLEELPCGRHIVSADDVYINVMEAQLRSEEDAQYEVHKKYVDIQMDLQGEEGVLLSNVGANTVTTPYDLQTDYELQTGSAIATAHLAPGYFAIFFPGEPHMPTLQVDGKAGNVKKAVVKVLWEK